MPYISVSAEYPAASVAQFVTAAYNFYNISDFGGSFFAFSSALGGSPTPSDLSVFTDTDNSLGFGGSVVATVGVDEWILHLDDAASFAFDDDDNELIISVRVEAIPVPEPDTFAIYGLGLAGLGFIRRRRRIA